MATRRIEEFLTGNRVAYSTINHRCAYTAQEIAQTSHIPGKSLAKSVIIMLDGKLAMVAVPATRYLDLTKLEEQFFDRSVRLANEDDFCNRFDGCQLGTVPPLGNLFGLETFVDRSLTGEEYIAFNAGTHTDVFMIRYSDFVRVVQPRIVDASVEVAARIGSKRPARRRRDDDGDDRRSEPETSDMAQAECGCPILHHSGAD